MGRNKYVQCRTCLKQIRSDNLKLHIHKPPIQSMSIRKKYCVKVCSHCNKTMKSGNFARHMQRHKKSALENKTMAKFQDDKNKFEEMKHTGNIIKQLMNRENLDERILSSDFIKALQVSTETPSFDGPLRSWQEKLIQYLKPSDRNIIWVCGSKGNEGKTWFQRYLLYQHGNMKAFQSNVGKRSDAVLHALSKRIFSSIELFIFNVPRSLDIKFVPYTLFEEIKDGQAISSKYDSKYLDFKTPNIVLVFANSLPQKQKMSNDRWTTFDIKNG